MKCVLNASSMKEAEQFTIDKIGIDAIVLMERAALALFDKVCKHYGKNTKICVVAGTGNNGADGLACARMLAEAGFDVSIYICEGNHHSELFDKQLSIINSLNEQFNNICTITDEYLSDYDLYIDAMFGIGLNRELSDEYQELIIDINESEADIISVDIPSGLNATTGEVMGSCIEADYTVTFGAYKTGLFLEKGPDYAGEVSFADIGLWFEPKKESFLSLESDDAINNFPVAKKTAHKGTQGKTLIIAGSENIYGAAYLCAKAAFNMGVGMVKIVTHVNNRHSLQHDLPEVMNNFYDSAFDEKSFKADIAWADTIVFGPGVGMNNVSLMMLSVLAFEDLENKRVIVDADGINLCADNPEIFNKLCRKSKDKGLFLVLTPHRKELERLSRGTKDYAEKLFNEYKVVTVCKNAKTVIIGNPGFINLSGNPGMATAGSGDVLAGMLGGSLFRMQNFELSLSVADIVYLHGLAGDIAAKQCTTNSMTAVDILSSILGLWKAKLP